MQDAAPATLVAFVNTLDVDEGVDAFAEPGGLASWLLEHGLVPGRLEPGREDLERARALREALRAQLLQHVGEPPDADAAAALDRQAVRSGLAVRFDNDGVSVVPSATGVDGGLGRLLALVAEAMADGTWRRIKACRAEDCRWAFVDLSRNGSRCWCSMEVCGNREKARAFRARATPR